MKVITGPFHPDLEHALAGQLRQLKADDPLAPVAVVVPSTLLVGRVRDLLVLEQGLSLLNVHLLTFHQLARRLYEDSLIEGGQAAGLARLDLVGGLFFEELLGLLIAGGRAELALLRTAAGQAGGRGTLWTTLRDLRDAEVDPETTLRALDEGVFDAEDEGKLRAVFTLHLAVQQARARMGIGSPDDLASAVARGTVPSRFLAGLIQVIYYGFYDLTQVQLSLLDLVATAAPVTVYFPLVPSKDFAFARRFFERAILPRAAVVESGRCAARTPDDEPAKAQAAPECLVLNAVGAEDELTLVCKEVLTLVDTHGYHWQDIGIVARTLDPYRGSLRRQFDRHRIPFTSTATTPLMQEPAAKILLQLATLPVSQFYRAHVLDVLTCPFYRVAPASEGECEPRPDLWRLAVRALAIRRGETDWRRLASLPGVEVNPGPSQDREGDWEAGAVTIPGAQLRLLWQLVVRLIEDCRTLPPSGRIGALTEAFLDLAKRHLAVNGLTGEDVRGDRVADRSREVGAMLGAVLEEMRQLDRLGVEITWEDWVRLFARGLERATRPVAPDDHPGVRVLDAMSARGLPFRALLVIGLNEKVFPRFIHEDAFLRDRERRVLDATLGFKIDEKLGGYEEEALLMALLRQAARERLYFLYQRADADGRPLAASPYLAGQLPARAGQGDDVDVRLPRRFSDRLTLPLFAPGLLTRDELAIRLILQRADPTDVLEADGRDAGLFGRGCQVLRSLEGEQDGLGPFDGDTGPLADHWSRLRRRGLAPTPLQQYADCPFRYFAGQVLHLESVRMPVGLERTPADVGRLCHGVIRIASERLLTGGWPMRELAKGAVPAAVHEAVETVFAEAAAGTGVGYVLLWDLLREEVAELAIAVLQQDEAECRASGFVPIGFEVDAEGCLEERVVPEGEGLKLRGRCDRVDASTRSGQVAWRVVDFKYRIGARMADKDETLLSAAVRGFRLQPPLYALLEVPGADDERAGHPESVEFVYLAPSWDPVVQRARFESAEWDGPAGAQLRETLRRLVSGVRHGQFPILPERYCEHCEFRTACRRYHGPTWWRAHRSELARQLRRMRKQKVDKTVTGDA